MNRQREKEVRDMATVNSKEMVDEIIAANGHYMGDPQVVKIVQYQNMFDGGTAYGLIYRGDDPMRYEDPNGACINPKVIFEAK
jgi:hypothetical protein